MASSFCHVVGVAKRVRLERIVRHLMTLCNLRGALITAQIIDLARLKDVTDRWNGVKHDEAIRTWAVITYLRLTRVHVYCALREHVARQAKKLRAKRKKLLPIWRMYMENGRPIVPLKCVVVTRGGASTKHGD